MSITIRHLDGPLKGDPKKAEVSFGDETSSILIGRAAKAEISYPEECIAVDGEHLRLNREADGSYTIELPGSCDVELNGKPAETGEPVTSGSVIIVGEGGPRFEVVLPGLTIKHLAGPLAGTQQFFPLSTAKIVFGRPPEKTDVAYPADYTMVGRLHFSLKKTDLGAYCVELTPQHYVEVDGEPAKNGSTVKSGSKFRLAGPKGPTFEVLVDQTTKQGVVTEVNYAPPSEFKLIKQLQRVAAVLFAVLLAGGSWFLYRDWQHRQDVEQLAADLAKADAKLTELAENTIPKPAQDALQRAVYLVARVENGKDIGMATAWAFGPDALATNAHVTKEIAGHEADWVLISPDGKRIPIKGVDTHPGYKKFKAFMTTVGGTAEDQFKQLNVINEYDVGIIHTAEALPPDSKTGQVVTLKLAPESYVEKLEPGAAVAAIGFPIEGMTATMVVTDAPATLHFGNISSLTDVFMCRADTPDDQLLIQHTVPVTGGMSGSPLIDKSGDVIGIVSGGNTANVVKEVTVAKGTGGETAKGKVNIEIDGVRIPSAALVNFAQRIDLLDDLNRGTAEADRKVAGDWNYWEEAAKKFVRYFESAADELTDSAKARYGVGETTREKMGEGALTPSKTGSASYDSKSYSLTLQPGHVYGFIANSKSGIPIALNVKKQGTSEFLSEKADRPDAEGPEQAPLAPTVRVTVDQQTQVDVNVFGMITEPAEYELYVYDWVKPAESSSAEPAATPQP
jgi:hypothetical protein